MRAARSAPIPQPRPRVGPGLRLRLWLACLSGALVASAGTLWILATPSLTPTDPRLYGWLAGVACASLVVGLVLGLWIDHHIVGHLHGLLLGLRSSRVAELRGLPAGNGWGELSELGDAVQETLERRHREVGALHELERLREHLTTLRTAVDRWQLTERWERPAIGEGEVAAAADVLGHALQRRTSVDEQNREAARQVASELSAAIADATEAASRAERGFVEATSLQTSVRELQRLANELAMSLTLPTGTTPPAVEPVADRARAALEDLVEASSASVESLGRGLVRVQDVSEQVQRIANRATLIAIQALSGTSEPAAFAEELKQLSRDVREATDRTSRYAIEIDAAVAEADARMREARERALDRLDVPVPAAPAPAPPTRGTDVARLVERVLEMVQDAGSKAERVSTASERASSVAERVARRLEGNASDAEALVVRLAPIGEPAVSETTERKTSDVIELKLVDVTPIAAGERSELGESEPREDFDVDARDDARREEERP